jgi:hypothetical protein
MNAVKLGEPVDTLLESVKKSDGKTCVKRRLDEIKV